MPRYIMKLTDEKTNKDYYFEWSTIVDAPVTYGQPLEDFKKYYEKEYGANGMKDLPEKLKRADEFGVSAYPPFDRIENYLSFNRAGENETLLDKEGILEKYCRNWR